jgi:pSer/pThr/pTyr-binding forkhead associated (FHA) protein
MQVILHMVRAERPTTQLAFGPGEYRFGRDPSCEVRIGVDNKHAVSRLHCVLQIANATAFIRDLHSRNGTIVNGARITSEHRLKTGDRIRIGSFVFHVVLPEGECLDDHLLCHAFHEGSEETMNVPFDGTIIGDPQDG